MKYIIVCDLEATCWDDGFERTEHDLDVIEIGCVLADLKGVIHDKFVTFVKPTRYPHLSNFCQRLTSISQHNVDSAPNFPEAMALLDKWAENKSEYWGSWGNFDRKIFQSQCEREDISSSFMSLSHTNLKRAWRRSTRLKGTSLEQALKHIGLEFSGTAHRGIDDALNTARLLPVISNNALFDHQQSSDNPG